MRRFISADLEGQLESNATLTLPKAASRHLLKVLRLKEGAQVELCDGNGTSAIGTIQGSEIEIGKVETHDAPEKCCVVLSIIKSERFRFAIEKLAELGITEIRPLLANRSQLKIPKQKRADRLVKWNLIAENAIRQSGRYFTPKIYLPDSAENISKLDYNHILTDPNANKGLTKIENPAIWIGPEGGFDNSEFELLQGFKTLYLSDAILRAETAAIVATTLIKTSSAGVSLGSEIPKTQT